MTNCLRRALELDPKSIEVSPEAAHFFDAVMPDGNLARQYATNCRARAMHIIDEMDEILAEP